MPATARIAVWGTARTEIFLRSHTLLGDYLSVGSIQTLIKYKVAFLCGSPYAKNQLTNLIHLAMVHSCPLNLAPAIQRINTQFILFGLTTSAASVGSDQTTNECLWSYSLNLNGRQTGHWGGLCSNGWRWVQSPVILCAVKLQSIHRT